MRTLYIFLIVTLFSFQLVHAKKLPPIENVEQHEWKLVSINGEEVEGGFGLKFDQPNEVTGVSPCNILSAIYKVHKDKIVFSHSSMTEMECGDSISAVEYQLYGLLNGEMDYELAGTSLVVTKGTNVYVFQAIG